MNSRPLVIINGKFLSQPLTGVQRYASELCLALLEIGANIQVVAPTSAKSNPLSKKLKAKFIGSSSGHLWEQTELVYYLRKLGNPLLLNLCNLAPLFYSNQIVTFHDLAFFRSSEWFSRKFTAFYRFITPRLAKKARHILTVSDFSKSEIMELLREPEDKVTVIHNAPSDLSNQGSSSIQNFQVLPKKYILAISSLNRRKNLLTLLKAAQKLHKKSSIPLVLVGESAKSYSTCPELSQALMSPHIIHISRVSDFELSELYKEARLFIYPSLYEGFGLPPIEAMSLGCQPIVSNIPPHKEVCKEHALYFDPHDSEALLTKIEQGLAKKPKKAQLKKHAHSFSWNASAKALLATIEKLNQTSQAKEPV